MSELASRRCTACRPGAPRVSAEERAELLRTLPAWQVVTVQGEDRLERVFTFPNFAAALAFANAVGAEAEAEDHHPALLVEWGKVTVTWWTHAIGGLHENDFIMAAKTDALATPRA
jgi:4a-hydroxytetrahydrobiopterin dehydratase